MRSATGSIPQHVERLAAYWAEALGGPRVYSDSYGDETTVVKIHSGNGVHEEMDRRAIVCFDQALAARGYEKVEQISVPLKNGESLPLVRMAKEVR